MSGPCKRCDAIAVSVPAAVAKARGFPVFDGPTYCLRCMVEFRLQELLRVLQRLGLIESKTELASDRAHGVAHFWRLTALGRQA